MIAGRLLLLCLCLVIAAMFAMPAQARTIPLTDCRGATSADVDATRAAQIEFRCGEAAKSVPMTAPWRWVRVAMPANRPGVGQVVLFRQTRFDALHLIVRDASDVVADRRLESGRASDAWIVGGYAAFSVPAASHAGTRTLYLGLSGSPTSSVLRARVLDTDTFALDSTRWTATVGILLGVLATSLIFNIFLFAALRTPATAAQTAWNASVMLWAMFWSQISLLLFPDLAGTWNARIASVFAASSCALPTLLLLTAVEPGKLPKALRRFMPFPALSMVPVVLVVIFVRDPVTPLRIFYDAAVVVNGLGLILGCAIAWARGSMAARTIVWTFTLPIVAAVLFAIGSLGGGSAWGLWEINVMAMAAAQTVLLTASLTKHFLTVRRDRDRALGQERHALALAETATRANQAKSAFLLRLSHEVRTPLNAVSVHAQLLKREGSATAAQAGAIIQRGTDHIAGLISDLLEISLLEAGRVVIVDRPFSLTHVLKDIADLLKPDADARNVRLILDIAASLPASVQGDALRVRQQLLNLASNAIRYTDQDSVVLQARYADGIATLSVIDRGPGIDAAELDRLWSPFERGRRTVASGAGLGLGLPIVQRLAAAMNGTVRAESTPGIGSTFTLSLPLPVSETAPSHLPRISGATAMSIDGRHHRLLVVDDDEAHRSMMHALLTPMDFTVDVAVDATDALRHDRPPPDLAILDISMPGRSGWEVAADLRTRFGDDIAILMCSADVHQLHRARSDDAPHDDVLAKPFTIDELLERITTLLGLNGAASSPPS